MHIVVLDFPRECETAPSWEALENLGAVSRFASTTLPELLDRAQGADILITRSFPLRREVLDYVTRPRAIVVPEEHQEELVEMPIARQLGVTVLTVPASISGCEWIRGAAEALARHLSA